MKIYNTPQKINTIDEIRNVVNRNAIIEYRGLFYAYDDSVSSDIISGDTYIAIKSNIHPGGWILRSTPIKKLNSIDELRNFREGGYLAVVNGVLYEFKPSTSPPPEFGPYIVHSNVLDGYWTSDRNIEPVIAFLVSERYGNDSIESPEDGPIISTEPIIRIINGLGIDTKDVHLVLIGISYPDSASLSDSDDGYYYYNHLYVKHDLIFKSVKSFGVKFIFHTDMPFIIKAQDVYIERGSIDNVDTGSPSPFPNLYYWYRAFIHASNSLVAYIGKLGPFSEGTYRYIFSVNDTTHVKLDIYEISNMWFTSIDTIGCLIDGNPSISGLFDINIHNHDKSFVMFSRIVQEPRITVWDLEDYDSDSYPGLKKLKDNRSNPYSPVNRLIAVDYTCCPNINVNPSRFRLGRLRYIPVVVNDYSSVSDRIVELLAEKASRYPDLYIAPTLIAETTMFNFKYYVMYLPEHAIIDMELEPFETREFLALENASIKVYENVAPPDRFYKFGEIIDDAFAIEHLRFTFAYNPNCSCYTFDPLPEDYTGPCTSDCSLCGDGSYEITVEVSDDGVTWTEIIPDRLPIRAYSWSEAPHEWREKTPDDRNMRLDDFRYINSCIMYYKIEVGTVSKGITYIPPRLLKKYMRVRCITGCDTIGDKYVVAVKRPRELKDAYEDEYRITQNRIKRGEYGISTWSLTNMSGRRKRFSVVITN